MKRLKELFTKAVSENPILVLLLGKLYDILEHKNKGGK